MTRTSVSLVTLLMLLGCPPAAEDETTTSSPATTQGVTTGGTTMGGATVADSGSTAGDATHGLTSSEDTATTGECEMFDYSEVRGCPDPVGQPFCSEGSSHHPVDTELEWEANPPHSGPHWPMWSQWGEYDAAVEREYWIHNLEHGGIVLSYRCPGGCDEDVEVLRAVMEMRPELRILITPDPELPADGFAAIAWTWVYEFDTPDLDTLLCFVDQHENHAPEDVP